MFHHNRHHIHEPGFGFWQYTIFGLEVNNENWCFTFNTLVFKNLCKGQDSLFKSLCKLYFNSGTETKNLTCLTADIYINY